MSFTFYILRHGKSDRAIGEVRDFDRSLNSRGRESTKLIGKWMLANKHIPQQIISSNSLRTKQTTKLLTAELGENKPNILYNRGLYLAGIEKLLEVINFHKNTNDSLMLVGHNPGLEELVYYLSADGTNKKAERKALTTANLVVLKYPDANFNSLTDKGELIAFIKPKELA